MGNTYVLYNPLSGNGKGEDNARLLEVVLPEPVFFFDMTRITNYDRQPFQRKKRLESHKKLDG